MYTNMREYKFDPMVKEAMDAELVLFPLNSTGVNDFTNPNHFTLLVLNNAESKWTHYNSMRPRKEDQIDDYFKDAIMVKDYYEKKKNEILRQNEIEMGVEQATAEPPFEIISYEKSPQQESGSQDCGIFVCRQIEDIYKNREFAETFPLDSVRKYRAHLANKLLKDYNPSG